MFYRAKDFLKENQNAHYDDYKAIYLPQEHDWMLGKDDECITCLVPLKKDEEK